MGQQPPGIVMKGRQWLCLEAALNAFQQLQVVTDDHIGPLRQQQLYAVDLAVHRSGSRRRDHIFVQPGGLSLITTPAPPGRTRRSKQNDSSLGLNGQRDTAEGHQAQPAYALGRRAPVFYIPPPLRREGSERMWPQPPIPVNIEPRHGD